MSYSDDDLNQAVEAGVLSKKDAEGFRHFITSRRGETASSEEHFRLITGFNDIFVAIAVLLVLVASWYLGDMVSTEIGALTCGLVSWGLAEYFTRIRRMALPSIQLLVSFITAAFFVIPVSDPFEGSILQPLAALAATGLHWWRFRVPITIAAAMASAVLLIIILIVESGVEIDDPAFVWVVMGLGIITLAKAIWWDSRNPLRTTRHADVAFWLHMLSAVLIVHPLFSQLSETDTTTGVVIVLAVYSVLSILSIILDRRALMVAALGYALYATSNVFIQAGNDDLAYALSGMVIGGGLLMLSAFWVHARRHVMRVLPEAVVDRLPPA